MGRTTDNIRRLNPAAAPLHDSIDSPNGDTGTAGERRVRTIHSLDIRSELHTDIFSRNREESKGKNARFLRTVKNDYNSDVTKKNIKEATSVDLTDDQAIAHHLLPKLYTRASRKRSAVARAADIDPHKLVRWIKGGTIKGEDLPRLHLLEGYSEAYHKLKGTKPPVNADVTECLTRLHRTIGRSLLKQTVFDLESLFDVLEPSDAAEAIASVVRIARGGGEAALQETLKEE